MSATTSAPAPAIRAKIAKPDGGAFTSIELEVAKYLTELENNPQCEIQSEVAFLKISGATELNVGGDENKKFEASRSIGNAFGCCGRVVVISFPYRVFVDHVRKVQARLMGELEKKLGKQVVVFGKRRIMTKRNVKQAGMKVRPHSRTLTAVQEAILEDIVGPIEVVGKRIRVRVDGSKLHKVFLDPKDENKENVEKLDTFAEVYKRLTAKTAVFSFRDY